MSLSDKFLVAFIGVWLGLTAAFFLVGLQIWGWTWLAIISLVGLAEAISYVRLHRTITQRFRTWGVAHPVQGYFLLAGMAVAWALLLLHLGVR